MICQYLEEISLKIIDQYPVAFEICDKYPFIVQGNAGGYIDIFLPADDL